MVWRRCLVILIASVSLIAAARKTVGTARGENEDLRLTATLYVDPEDVKGVLGSDLGGHYIVAEVSVEPKYGKEVTLDRDDFLLRTNKDGEKSRPFVGSQIAGQEALVISEEGAQTRRSRGLGSIGLGGGVIGGGSGDDHGQTKTTMKSDETANPVRKVLDSRILQDGKTAAPVKGLLYFPMEKQKLKDLELLYGGRENRITLRFK